MVNRAWLEPGACGLKASCGIAIFQSVSSEPAPQQHCPSAAPHSGAYAFEIAEQDYARNGRMVRWATAEIQTFSGGVLVFTVLPAMFARTGPNDSS
jgi:hypothetical protein